MAFLVFPRVLEAYKLSRIEKMFEMTEAYAKQMELATSSTGGAEKVGGRGQNSAIYIPAMMQQSYPTPRTTEA